MSNLTKVEYEKALRHLRENVETWDYDFDEPISQEEYDAYDKAYGCLLDLINEHFDNPPLSFTKGDLVKIKLSLENTVNEYRSELRNIEMSEVMKNAHVKRMNQYEEVLKKVEDEIKLIRENDCKK